jgi:hypothetical protein
MHSTSTNKIISIEQNVVIVAACIPTLRPFFRKTFNSTKGSSGGSNSHTRSGSAFKLGNIPSRKGPASVSEFPLKDAAQKIQGGESHGSENGSWHAMEP